MRYELRTAGAAAGRYSTEEEAVAAAREALRADADAQIDIVDTATCQPVAPGASQSWREELARRVGF